MPTQYAHEFLSPRSSNQLLWTLSPQATFRYFSSTVCAATGWFEADWQGKSLRELIHRDDFVAIGDRFREILAGETVQFEHIRCVTPTGNLVPWSLSFVPVCQHGTVSEIVVLGRSSEGSSVPAEGLTVIPLVAASLPERSAEAAAMTKLFEGMLGNAPIALALLGENLRYICLNEAFSEMTGYSPSQHLGQSLRGLLPQVAEIVEPVMESVLRTGVSTVDLEVKLAHSLKLRSTRYAQMSFYPIPDLRGGFCGVATIAVDVSERKLAESKLKKISRELARSNRALQEFSYIASHDLHEPLRTIAGFMKLLRKRCDGSLDSEGKEYVTQALEGTVRMQRLIEKLLEYSHSESKQQESSVIDCNAVVDTVLRNLNASLDESGVSVKCDMLPVVRGDELLLTQVFQNLVSNAIKYRCAVSPQIRISVRRDGETWVFAVADNGIGINSDHFLSVFAPFRKLHSSSQYPGVGLGLAICRKNIERHGGNIWVESERGRGSTFSFSLPANVNTGTSSHDRIERAG